MCFSCLLPVLCLWALLPELRLIMVMITVLPVITSTKEVMFSSAFVCLLISRLMQTYSTDFHKIRWKGGTEETIRF